MKLKQLQQSRNRTTDEPSFAGADDSDETPLLRGRRKSVDDAWEEIRRKFPKINPQNSPFTAKMDDFGRVMIKLKRIGGKDYPLFKTNGELNDKLPRTVIKSFGRTAEDIVEINERNNKTDRVRIEQLSNLRERTDISQGEKDTITNEIASIEERISLRDQENEIIQERTSK